ncbi:MAG: hypothetical protein WC438_03885 [Candidatus Pacearchaeota archaeon]
MAGKANTSSNESEKPKIVYRRYLIESSVKGDEIIPHPDFYEPMNGETRHFNGWHIEGKSGEQPLLRARYLDVNTAAEFYDNFISTGDNNVRKDIVMKVFSHENNLDYSGNREGRIIYLDSKKQFKISNPIFDIIPKFPEKEESLIVQPIEKKLHKPFLGFRKH